MKPFQESIQEYKKQLKKGSIQVAYKGLIEYIMGLKTLFLNKYPEYFVSASIYHGFMDMTFFSICPKSLKERKLKIVVVFIHESFQFEVWLAGVNKQVQKKYWELVKEKNWDKYQLVSSIEGADSIIGHVLVNEPDFSDTDDLTKIIEQETLFFIMDVENFLSRTEN